MHRGVNRMRYQATFFVCSAGVAWTFEVTLGNVTSINVHSQRMI